MNNNPIIICIYLRVWMNLSQFVISLDDSSIILAFHMSLQNKVLQCYLVY